MLAMVLAIVCGVALGTGLWLAFPRFWALFARYPGGIGVLVGLVTGLPLLLPFRQPAWLGLLSATAETPASGGWWLYRSC